MIPAKEGFVHSLSWSVGVMLALGIPISTFCLIGLEIGPIGAWGALVIWCVTSVIALAQNLIYAEMAITFGTRSGGIGTFAHEAWRRYATPLGAVAIFGYWMGWTVVLAVFGLQIGRLVQAQWLPGWTGTIGLAGNQIGIAHLIAGLSILAVYLLNIRGLKLVARVNRAASLLLGIMALVCMIGPFFTVKLDFSNLHWHLPHHVSGAARGLFVWGFIASWTTYGTELCATFAAEYHNPREHIRIALIVSSLLVIAVTVLSCVMFPAVVGEDAIRADPVGFYVEIVTRVVGPGLSNIVILMMCLAQFVTMSCALAGSSRALHGLSSRGLTLRQLDRLNAHGVPARAMTVDLLANLCIVFFIADITGIIFAANIGYILTVVLTLSGFVLMRRARSTTSPAAGLREKPLMPLIAASLVLFNVIMLAIGFTNPELIGYGGRREQMIAISVLMVSIVLFLYRRTVQDSDGLRLQERQAEGR